MPFRTHALLEAWLQEFILTDSPIDAHVAMQDGTDGADTGLVIIELRSVMTGAYLQPLNERGDVWAVTFEPREIDLTLTPDEIVDLANELITAARLCRFLEHKTKRTTTDSTAH